MPMSPGKRRVAVLSDRLCECGCGERTFLSPYTDTAKGWVKGEPRRFARGHQLRMCPPREKRFRLRIVKVRGRKIRWCACGCGRPIVGRSKRARFVVGHAPSVRPLRVATRWVEEDRGYGTACWIWQLAVHVSGYGRVKVDGKRKIAHRVVYEQLRGPIPEGRQLHHLCGVKLCVNPDHVEALTPEAHGLMHGDASHFERRAA